jgi:hypothetical protein
VSGQTYSALGNNSTVAGALLGASELNFNPFFVASSATYDQISVATASSFSGSGVVRLGIYDDNGGLPGNLVLDAGTVSATAASTVYTITISQTLSAGMYFLCVVSQTQATTNNYIVGNTNTTLLSPIMVGFPLAFSASVQLGFRETGVSGALPSSAGTITRTSSAVKMQMRVA